METYWIVAGIVVLLFYFALHQVQRRQADLEHRLVEMSRRLGLVAEAGSEPSEKVQRLAADRSTYVEALRTYRTETGSDIKQSKRVIDPLRPRR